MRRWIAELPGALRAAVVGTLLLLAIPASACGPSVELQDAIELSDLNGGWYDAGVENGKNKLVPSVTFSIRKKTDHDLRALALNVMFRREGQDGNFDEVYLQKVELTEQGETGPMTVRARYGYTGDVPQTRAQMLEHSQFKDVKVVIFGRQTSANWIELAQFDVPRQLLTD